MGTFRTTIKIENPLKRGEFQVLLDTRVDEELIDAGQIVAAVA